MRYKIIYIPVFIRKLIIFLAIFGFLTAVFAFVMAVGQITAGSLLGQNQWLISAISLFIIIFIVRPAEKFVNNAMSRILFKKRYEYQRALRDAAAGMAAIRDPKKLLELIVHIISIKIRLSNVTIFIYDDKQKQYQLKAARGRNKPKNLREIIARDEPLIEWLKEKRSPITLSELQDRVKGKQGKKIPDSIQTPDLRRITAIMQRLNASICVPSFYRNELLAILVLGDKDSGEPFAKDDIELFNTLADEAAIAIKNSQLYFELDKKAGEITGLYEREHNLFMRTAAVFAAAIDARDPYTRGHSERVTNYSLLILDYMSYAPEVAGNPVFRQRLQIAGVLHDIGKIGVSDDILHKPGRLTDEEQKEMQKHSVIGAEIVSRIKALSDIVGGIRHHHERYDGAGYPDGLKADNIPFIARIIAVADTYDAMTSDRPYRKRLSEEAAKEEIKKNQSMQFDPYMTAAFLKAFESGRMGHSV